MDFKKLKAEFAPNDIEFRAGKTNKQKTSALAFPYLTSRAVMDRLDDVIGPENWQDEFKPGPDGGVICGLSIKVGSEWITKWDGAQNTDFEPVKGGLSDSFKRVAVKWGIGRYLYSLPVVWVSCEVYGKTVKINEAEARAKAFGKKQTTTASPKPQAQTNGNTAKKPVTAAQPTLDGKKQDAVNLPDGPVKDFWNICTADSPGYYKNPYQLDKAVGGYGNLQDPENFAAKRSAASDHAKEKQQLP